MALRKDSSLETLQTRWSAVWEEALAMWSRFTKLSPPRWCHTTHDERQEGLLGSFAMIRLLDHAVVVSLRQIEEHHLEPFALEILAHEIGHHVYAPANMTDNARLAARVRAGLPTREKDSMMVANLYTDLLINDRLQRGADLNITGVYKALKPAAAGRLWTMYMGIYESLWRLPPLTLTSTPMNPRMALDSQLGAKLIRVYARDWLDGAGRFAALCLPYLIEDKQDEELEDFEALLDTVNAGAGADVPDGLTEVEDGETEGAIHPSEDRELTGLGGVVDDRAARKAPASATSHQGGSRETVGGRKNRYREPTHYVDIMKSLQVDLPEDEIIIRYYRELARPHLIRFPERRAEMAQDPLPEGLESWQVGDPLEDLDWVESVVRSPHVIPGVTTYQRTYGRTEGGQPERIPVDLYVGIDCSGSMGNPRHVLSYPVLAGAIVALSALRAHARVMAVLSGEPGEYVGTAGFVRTEHEVLKLLTGYLGTGYSFGVLRLKEAFLDAEKRERPVHVLVITDSDIFHMLGEVKNGWEIARDAIAAAGGGGTCVLQIPGARYVREEIEKLGTIGWEPHIVTNEEEMVAFARAFAKRRYGDEDGGGVHGAPPGKA